MSINDAGRRSPLDGLDVVDFSRVLAGPLATMILGDLGANVTKIERPELGDDTRAWGPPYDDGGASAYFLALNRNKRSLSLDLTKTVGREEAFNRASKADVVLENFKPGDAEKFGLDYEAIKSANPSVVYCSIAAYGPDAKDSLAGYDFVVQALSGLMNINGTDLTGPLKVGVPIVDVVTGLYANIATMTALQVRETRGFGQHVTVDLLSSGLSTLVNHAANAVISDVIEKRWGNEHPSIVPYAVFATETEPMVIAAGNDSQFARLCRALDAPWMVNDQRWTTNAQRVKHRESLSAAIEDKLRLRSAAYWTERLNAVGIACAPVLDIREALNFAKRLGVEPVVSITDPVDKQMRYSGIASPMTFSETPVSYRIAPPDLESGKSDVSSPDNL